MQYGTKNQYPSYDSGHGDTRDHRESDHENPSRSSAHSARLSRQSPDARQLSMPCPSSFQTRPTCGLQFLVLFRLTTKVDVFASTSRTNGHIATMRKRAERVI